MRKMIHVPNKLGDKIADMISAGMGSWAFVIAQTVIITFWITINLVGYFYHFDPMPFILLNLVFSTQAAYASPLILMAQNRQASKDRMRDDLESEEVDAIFRNNAILLKINEEQVRILNQQSNILDLLHKNAMSEGFKTSPLSQRNEAEESLRDKDDRLSG